MVSPDLLEILRCPVCVQKGPDEGRLELVGGEWLVCQSEGCNRKYPIRDGIPNMLIEEGDKYVAIPVEELSSP